MDDKQIKLRIYFSDDSNVTHNTPLPEGESLLNDISDSERATNIAPDISNPERVPVLGNRYGSIAQTTRSGRRIIKPKKLIISAILGILSYELGEHYQSSYRKSS